VHDVKTDAALDSAWSGGKSPFAIGSKKLGMWLFIVSGLLLNIPPFFFLPRKRGGDTKNKK